MKDLVKPIKNETGAMAMLGAVVFTIAITTTLSTFYIYSVNQAKYHARIKEAYQMINVMEAFAAATRKAVDMGQSVSTGGGSCPAGTTAATYSGVDVCQPTNNQVCITREDNGQEICTQLFSNALNFKEKNEKYVLREHSWMKSWLRKLNHFYSSPALKTKLIDRVIVKNGVQRPYLLDWFFAEANAQITPEVGNSDGNSGRGNPPTVNPPGVEPNPPPVEPTPPPVEPTPPPVDPGVGGNGNDNGGIPAITCDNGVATLSGSGQANGNYSTNNYCGMCNGGNLCTSITSDGNGGTGSGSAMQNFLIVL